MQDVARQVYWSSSYLFTAKQPFLSRIPLFSPYLFLLKWPKSIPFPAFGSTSKHPTVSLTQPHNVSHSPRQQPPFVLDSLWWVSHLDNRVMLSWDAALRGLARLSLSLDPYWPPACQRASVLLSPCGAGPLVSWWLLWWASEQPGWGIIWAFPTLLLCLWAPL